MGRRPIIHIDEELCDGCGECVLACAEGALAVVDGKAKLLSESYCDGLGACLHCPNGALSIEEREAEPFDEKATDKKRENSARKPSLLRPAEALGARGTTLNAVLPSWPIELRLLSSAKVSLSGAHLLLAAHCAGFALPSLHTGYMPGRIPVICCPKLEPWEELRTHLTDIFSSGDLASITVLRMSVPCCGGILRLLEEVRKNLGISMPVDVITVTVP
ncbi:MAG: 4Fe-4S binding protein [Desulfovibrio sp.]|nr:4Fe-4S binding protein [Desulfovibrio sp.]